ncbi:nitronate monooxygenase [bacterium]|nr:nitronate monooxygenase [bacterium]
MNSEQPKIIQGGMGAGVSWWILAQAVAKLGQLGVVSGTAIDLIFARRLQDGDPGGHMRRAVDHFPFPEMAERVWSKYYVPGGKAPDQPYKPIPMYSRKPPRPLVELCIVANFAEVFLAREGHDGSVGINYLEKIQMPHLPSIYGAMLAGVTYILMGAGIPIKIPGILDAFVNHEPAVYALHVVGAQEGDDTTLRFDPREFMEGDLPPLHRPFFLPIIASNTLAEMMIRKANGRIDGFVIEGPTAGGHNAPPRGKLQLNEAGEPVYGERDKVDYEKIRALGLPFWLAGSQASAARLREVLALGAAGIQVGTAFAFCEESGMNAEYRLRLLQKSAEGTARVYTDPIASPTGFPFKVALLDNTVSRQDLYLARKRVCDLGYLREAYRRDDGGVGYRCSSEPVDDYVAKSGKLETTVGRKCLCNALMANIGHAQIRGDGAIEKPLITCGDDLAEIARFRAPGRESYSAKDVINRLLA